MFGGGTGALSIIVENKKKRNMPAGLEEEMEVKDEEEIVFEQGIEINVSLPHKKVKRTPCAFGRGEIAYFYRSPLCHVSKLTRHLSWS